MVHQLYAHRSLSGHSTPRRRFLLHVLPTGFHRIRHYGLLANASRAARLARARELLTSAETPPAHAHNVAADRATAPPTFVCRRCGGPMIILQVFARAQTIRAPPQAHAS